LAEPRFFEKAYNNNDDADYNNYVRSYLRDHDEILFPSSSLIKQLLMMNHSTMSNYIENQNRSTSVRRYKKKISKSSGNPQQFYYFQDFVSSLTSIKLKKSSHENGEKYSDDNNINKNLCLSSTFSRESHSKTTGARHETTFENTKNCEEGGGGCFYCTTLLNKFSASFFILFRERNRISYKNL
jgi:hypothetical protein